MWGQTVLGSLNIRTCIYIHTERKREREKVKMAGRETGIERWKERERNR